MVVLSLTRPPYPVHFHTGSEVSQLQVPFEVKQHVVWLDVSVHIAHAMDGFHSQHQLSTVELGPVLRHCIATHQVYHVSTWPPGKGEGRGEGGWRVGGRVEGVGERVEGVGERVEGVGERVEGVGERVEGMGERVEGVGERVEGVGEE